MQSKKRSYSPITMPFNRHIVSFGTGSLLSIVIGLIFCFIIFMFIGHSSLAKNAAGKQIKPRYENSGINDAVPFNDKIAVAES